MVAVTILGMVSKGASATNIAFFPGDAFFALRLSEDLIREIAANPEQSKRDIEFRYAYSAEYGTFGGFAGFERLLIRNVSSDLRDQLRRTYYALREYEHQELSIRFGSDGSRVSFETNPFTVFIYNRDVDWQRQRVGIKYNESWANLPPEAIEKLRGPNWSKIVASRYVPFLSTWQATAHDWKYAATFDPLRVEVPAGISWGLAGQPIPEPVAIDATKIQFVILPDEESLLDLFDRDEATAFVSLSPDGPKVVGWQDSKPDVSDWDFDPAPVFERNDLFDDEWENLDQNDPFDDDLEQFDEEDEATR